MEEHLERALAGGELDGFRDAAEREAVAHQRGGVEPAGEQPAEDLALLGSGARIGGDQPALALEQPVDLEAGALAGRRVGEEHHGAAGATEGEGGLRRRGAAGGVEDRRGAPAARELLDRTAGRPAGRRGGIRAEAEGGLPPRRDRFADHDAQAGVKRLADQDVQEAHAAGAQHGDAGAGLGGTAAAGISAVAAGISAAAPGTTAAAAGTSAPAPGISAAAGIA